MIVMNTVEYYNLRIQGESAFQIKTIEAFFNTFTILMPIIKEIPTSEV